MRLDNLQGAPRSTSPIDLPIPDATAAPAGNGSPAAPATGTAVALERRLADLLASVVKKDDVPVDANFFYDLGADSLVMAQFCARVRKQPDLPAVSIKDIYQNPTISALAAALAPAEVASATVQIQVQDRLAEVLSGVLDIEHVPVEADFFQDLGADSLVMAQFCARVRKQPDLPPVSIKDIYQNPTISALAAALGSTGSLASGSPVVAGTPASNATTTDTPSAGTPAVASARKSRGGRYRALPGNGHGPVRSTTSYGSVADLPGLPLLCFR